MDSWLKPRQVESRHAGQCRHPYSRNEGKDGNVALKTPWHDERREIATRIVAANQWDVVVAPVTTLGNGFENTERILISAEITRALAARKAGRVSDPLVMAQVGGEYTRVPDPDAVRKAARVAGARAIYWPSVCHDRDGRMFLMLDIEQPVGAALAETPVWPALSLEFSSHRLPHQAVADSLAVGVDIPGLRGAQAEQGTRINAARLPLPVPGGLRISPSEKPPAGEMLWRMELLGALIPMSLPSSRKSPHVATLALADINSNDPDVLLPRAWAYYWLGRRAVALDLLKDMDDAEASALRALLNGNAFQAREAIDNISRPLPRLLAELALYDVNERYDLLEPELRRQRVMDVAGNPGWLPLLERRLDIANWWQSQDNAELLAELKLREGLLAEPGASSLRQSAEREYAISVDTTPVDVFNRQTATLLEGMALANSLHWIRKLHYSQRRFDEGRKYAERLLEAYRGQPEVFFAYTEIVLADIRRAHPGARGLGSDTGDASKRLMMAGLILQSPRLRDLEGLNGSRASDLHAEKYMALDFVYRGDYPVRTSDCSSIELEFTSKSVDVIDRRLRDAVTGTVDGYACLQRYEQFRARATAVSKGADTLVDEMPKRFVDAPARFEAEIDARMARGELEQAAGVLKRWIDIGTTSSEPYDSLFWLRFMQGHDEEAWATILSYKALQDPSPFNRLELSNAAASFGRAWFLAGDLERSAQMDARAASYGTRAHGEYLAYVRLALQAGQYRDVASIYDAVYDHYGSASDLSMHLVWLHVLGESESAWQRFEEEINQPRGYDLLRSAVFGFRREGRSDAEMLAWMQRPEYKRWDEVLTRPVALATALHFTTDRKLQPNLARDAVARLENKQVLSIDSGGRAAVWGESSYPHIPPGKTTPDDPFSYIGKVDKPEQSPRGQDIPSALTQYMELQYQLQEGNFHRACDILADNRHPLIEIGHPVPEYLAPYFAYACVRSGRPDVVRALIEGMSARGKLGNHLYNFDFNVADAFLRAGAGDVQGAREAMRRAVKVGADYLEVPKISEFQLLQAYDWLQSMTNEQVFREDALALARTKRVTRPTLAFVHGYVARWTNSEKEKIEALAFALHLDPGSEMIKGMSKKDLAKARALMKAQPPFTEKEVAEVSGEGI